MEITDSMINEAVDTFDCEKIHKAMKAVGWRWWNAESEDGVPSPSEIRQSARFICENLKIDGFEISSSGGIVASRRPDNGHGKGDHITLSFVLEESYGR